MIKFVICNYLCNVKSCLVVGLVVVVVVVVVVGCYAWLLFSNDELPQGHPINWSLLSRNIQRFPRLKVSVQSKMFVFLFLTLKMASFKLEGETPNFESVLDQLDP